MPKNKDPLETRKRFNVALQLKSIKRRLEEYGNDPRIKDNPDAYVKSQLELHNRNDYYYPNIANDIMKGTVKSGTEIRKNPEYNAYLNLPENEAVKQRVAKKQGELFVTKESNLRPDQQRLSNELVALAREKAAEQYRKIGQPTSLEKPYNDLIMRLLNEYDTAGNKELNIFGGPENIAQSLRGLGQGVSQGAQQFGQGLADTARGVYQAGQGVANTINPYLQSALQTATPYAQSALDQGKSYLSAAQPYAKQAAGFGSDILNSIRGPAINAGQQTIQGLGGLLNMLKGRM